MGKKGQNPPTLTLGCHKRKRKRKEKGKEKRKGKEKKTQPYPAGVLRREKGVQEQGNKETRKQGNKGDEGVGGGPVVQEGRRRQERG